MTDGPTSEQIRQRAFRHIDPRGRPSLPGPSSLELVVEEQRMRDEVEGYGRKAPDAGTMEAAGIEPAFEDSQNGSSSRGFEHWKLDGELSEGEIGSDSKANYRLAAVDASPSEAAVSPSENPSNFTAKTTICGIDLEVRRDGKHLNLHMLLYEVGHLEQWRYEDLETAIPKLACILAAARLAANSS
jgi:hypothetical protein